jgi:hypothetical protein
MVAASIVYEDEENEYDEDDDDNNHDQRGGNKDDVVSISRGEDSEEEDEFENLGYEPMVGTDYQWHPAPGGGGEVVLLNKNDDVDDMDDDDDEDFDMSAALEKFDHQEHDYGEPSTNATGANNIVEAPIMGGNRRFSFNTPAMRRTSHAESIQSESSFQSAPARTEDRETMVADDYQPMQRRTSHAFESAKRRSSATAQRRASKSRFSMQLKPSEEGGIGDGRHSSVPGAGLLRNIRGRSSMRQSAILGTARENLNPLDTAIASLRKQDSNNEWENVAAAAAVVAASVSGASNAKSRIQFSPDEAVLVFLTLLNVTNMEDPKDTFTVSPVNKCGYPSGEGTTDAEKQGPYSFVLATVKFVHFDEDDRYYTIIRADTATEQRADSGRS